MEKQNLDLNKATRDELYFMLSAAKNELAKYTNYGEEIVRYKKCIEKERKDLSFHKFPVLQWIGAIVILFALSYGIYHIIKISQYPMYVFFIYLALVIFWMIYSGIIKSMYKKKTVQRNLKQHEAQLPKLIEEERTTFDKFFAIVEQYRFPRKYWDEYALTKMHEYLGNGEASNWERLAFLYNNHLHEKRMEEIAWKSFEEMKKQTEIAIQTRNAARWAAAGIWLN
ncbi:MAG: hypothetical protein LBU83_11095 [Bacteroidales bacterium]|jgi:ABC-type multidrug transport system fused ATPase/permease subunit|nr:hypothetical protein [Bacteroidales bacterium]